MVAGHEQSLVSPDISFVRRSLSRSDFQRLRVFDCDSNSYRGISEMLGIIKSGWIAYRAFSTESVAETLRSGLNLHRVCEPLKNERFIFRGV